MVTSNDVTIWSGIHVVPYSELCSAPAYVSLQAYREVEQENIRLRAALERYGRHEHPNCHDLTLKEDGSFGPRNGCLCGFDAAKGESSAHETSAPRALAKGDEVTYTPLYDSKLPREGWKVEVLPKLTYVIKHPNGSVIAVDAAEIGAVEPTPEQPKLDAATAGRIIESNLALRVENERLRAPPEASILKAQARAPRRVEPSGLADERRLRRMLAFAYSGPGELYGDDGELQNSAELPIIDFNRDSVLEIERKITERGNRRLARQLQQEKASEPPMAMLPNVHHPGQGCSCRECLRRWPDKASAPGLTDPEKVREASLKRQQQLGKPGE